MNRHKWWSIIDLLVAIAMGVAGSIWVRGSLNLTGKESNLRYSQGILGVYLILFAIIIGLTAVFYSAFFARYFAAAYSFLGKGFGYIFLGSIAVRDDEWLPLTLGIFVISIGILFFILHFISAVPSPVPLCSFGRSSNSGNDRLPRTTATNVPVNTVFTNPSYGFPPVPSPFHNDPSLITNTNTNTNTFSTSSNSSAGSSGGVLPKNKNVTITTSTINNLPSKVPLSPGYVPPTAESFTTQPSQNTSLNNPTNPFTVTVPQENPFSREPTTSLAAPSDSFFLSPDRTTTI